MEARIFLKQAVAREKSIQELPPLWSASSWILWPSKRITVKYCVWVHWGIFWEVGEFNAVETAGIILFTSDLRDFQSVSTFNCSLWAAITRVTDREFYFFPSNSILKILVNLLLIHLGF